MSAGPGQSLMYPAKVGDLVHNPRSGKPFVLIAPEVLVQVREALEWLASDEAWEVKPSYQKDGRYRFNAHPDSVYATPWGFARSIVRLLPPVSQGDNE